MKLSGIDLRPLRIVFPVFSAVFMGLVVFGVALGIRWFLNKRSAAVIESVQAMIAFDEGDLGKASDLYESALGTWRFFRDDERMPEALDGLGLIHLRRDELSNARERFEEALHLCEHTGIREYECGSARLGLITVCAREGDHEGAVSLLEEHYIEVASIDHSTKPYPEGTGSFFIELLLETGRVEKAEETVFSAHEDPCATSGAYAMILAETGELEAAGECAMHVESKVPVRPKDILVSNYRQVRLASARAVIALAEGQMNEAEREVLDTAAALAALKDQLKAARNRNEGGPGELIARTLESARDIISMRARRTGLGDLIDEMALESAEVRLLDEWLWD